MQTSDHSYDASKNRGTPLRFLPELLALPAMVSKHRALIWNFWRREFNGRFRGSLLGVLWVMINPLFIFAVYYTIFGVLLKSRALPHPDHYALYLLAGIVGWGILAETTQQATTAVVNNGNLIQKVAFPAQLLIFHTLAISLVVYGVGVGIMIIFCLLVGWPVFWLGLLGLPAIVAVQALLVAGLSWLLAAAYVFLRDLSQMWPILLQFWFFATPLFWHPGMVDDYELWEPYVQLNPMASIIEGHRVALGVGLQGATEKHPFPINDLGQVFACAGQALPWGIGFFILGFLVFRSVQHRFADEV